MWLGVGSFVRRHHHLGKHLAGGLGFIFLSTFPEFIVELLCLRLCLCWFWNWGEGGGRQQEFAIDHLAQAQETVLATFFGPVCNANRRRRSCVYAVAVAVAAVAVAAVAAAAVAAVAAAVAAVAVALQKRSTFQRVVVFRFVGVGVGIGIVFIQHKNGRRVAFGEIRVIDEKCATLKRRDVFHGHCV